MEKKRKCLISAGPTREWIDSVRFISNPSSGKMGYSLARQARDRNFEVQLISGPVSLDAPSGISIEKVETAGAFNTVEKDVRNGTIRVVATSAVPFTKPDIFVEGPDSR